MFEWLKRKQKKQAEPLVFDSAASAFDYACLNLDYPLRVEAVIPAIVEEEGKSGEEGEKYFRLRLATRNGGREVWGCILNGAPGRPAIGDMVGYRIVRYDEELPEGLDLLGFISCTLSPVLVPERGWRVERNLTPSDLKPVLRL